MSGHFLELRSLEGNAMNYGDSRAQESLRNEHFIFASSACVAGGSFRKVNDERVELTGQKAASNALSIGCQHFKREDVVYEFLLVEYIGLVYARIEVQLSGQALDTFLGAQTPHSGCGASGYSLDLPVAIHLATPAFLEEDSMGGVECILIGLQLLPVVAGSKFLARVPIGGFPVRRGPSRKQVPCQVVMQINEAWKKEAVCLKSLNIYGQIDVGSNRIDLVPGN